MKLMLFVLQRFRSFLGLDKPETVGAISSDRDRPLEQIINEGSLGKVEDERVAQCYVENPWNPYITSENKVIKTQAEQDFDFLKPKLGNRELVVMNETRYNGLLKLAFINEEADKWINGLQGKSDFVLIPGVVNIGIVKG